MITAIDKNTALVLIDLQKGIVKMKAAQPIQPVLDKSVILLNAFRKAGLPVVIVSVELNSASKWLKTRKDSNRIPRNPLVLALVKFLMTINGYSKIAKEIKTQPDDVFIVKNTPNAFYNTALHRELQKRNITNIVLAGVATSSGVEATARAAAERGYNISFAVDAMKDSKPAAHEASIRYIFPRIGELGTAAEIIEKLDSKV